ncbi:hypothetical protein GWI33_016189 [Rhynchophorus ferrugineus]|uniref:PWWP domain-containing protein n=1 Tax=Rhynchophorus ferrugineus TaxID=354439 RepID=A0A834HXU8_RHYFE|nr:hypothetical protein GWI33_016189 [Rhynchophorus ferrugineus]
MESNFKVGDLVWARMKSYPAWPARILESDSQKKGQAYVYFFGSKATYGHVPNSAVVPFDSTHKDNLASCKRPDFKIALQLAEEYRQSMEQSENKETEEAESEKGEDKSNSGSPKQINKSSRKSSVESAESSSSGKGKTKRKASDSMENGPKRSRSSITTLKDDSNGLSSRSDLLNRPAVLDRPDSPTVDFANSSEVIQSKEIEPSTLKFGFLGLGIMGQRIVKNLIQTGHHVNIWSRDPKKVSTLFLI